MPEVDQVLGNADKLEARSSMLGIGSLERIVQVNDIMSVRETASHLIAGLRWAGAGVRAGSERLRSSLHVLHYSLWSRAVALAFRCR